MFVPTTYGDVPDLGYTTTWGGETRRWADTFGWGDVKTQSFVYTVKQVQPLAPDGTVIMARIVVGK